MNCISEDDRTTARGLFNFGKSYWKSASRLQEITISDITHPDAPVFFLYTHAVELFLKSNLRLTTNLEELEKIGHHLKKLKELSYDLFEENSEYGEILDMLANHRINKTSRYIYQGYRQNYPTSDHLERLCSFLHNAVEQKIKNARTQDENRKFLSLSRSPSPSDAGGQRHEDNGERESEEESDALK